MACADGMRRWHAPMACAPMARADGMRHAPRMPHVRLTHAFTRCGLGQEDDEGLDHKVLCPGLPWARVPVRPCARARARVPMLVATCTHTYTQMHMAVPLPPPTPIMRGSMPVPMPLSHTTRYTCTCTCTRNMQYTHMHGSMAVPMALPHTTDTPVCPTQVRSGGHTCTCTCTYPTQVPSGKADPSPERDAARGDGQEERGAWTATTGLARGLLTDGAAARKATDGEEDEATAEAELTTDEMQAEAIPVSVPILTAAERRKRMRALMEMSDAATLYSAWRGDAAMYDGQLSARPLSIQERASNKSHCGTCLA